MLNGKKEGKCPHCGMDKKIRNPSGYCDHLYYPDSCDICKDIKELYTIYELIPNFDCKCCGQCCGPINWSLIEDILIKGYMKEHDIKYIKWDVEQYIKNGLLCPYFKNNKCIIYDVRPLICRLQGHTEKLPCPNNKNPKYISNQLRDKIARMYAKLTVCLK